MCLRVASRVGLENGGWTPESIWSKIGVKPRGTEAAWRKSRWISRWWWAVSSLRVRKGIALGRIRGNGGRGVVQGMGDESLGYM